MVSDGDRDSSRQPQQFVSVLTTSKSASAVLRMSRSAAERHKPVHESAQPQRKERQQQRIRSDAPPACCRARASRRCLKLDQVWSVVSWCERELEFGFNTFLLHADIALNILPGTCCLCCFVALLQLKGVLVVLAADRELGRQAVAGASFRRTRLPAYP